ncbi:MAG: hypothetical protein KIG85_06155 [Thiopseudomonas sp.]|nr:hypothetical protein [Thiopseudomonas sp.]
MTATALQALLLQRLHGARNQRQTLTYRQLLESLSLPAPKMQQLARLLEALAAQDAARGWPLRSALVISQTDSNLPRAGFFQHAQRLGLLPQAYAEAAWPSWHADELQRVFAFDYPEDAPCSGGNGGPS